jgi:poly(A) polymerase
MSKRHKNNTSDSKTFSEFDSYAIPFAKHGIKRISFHPKALKIIEQLESKNFQAFIVGGAVRDLLCGIEPKDFDISTNATPEQIDKLFSNSRIIGRRFRLIHIHFGREIFEVATFRGNHEDNDSQHKNVSQVSNQGQLLRDNVFGNIKEDALRRDFTVNSLYYSPSSECIYDFCNAIEDIKDKKVKLIGEPAQRYAEDPVRMLRALRFANKLKFSIEAETLEQISKSAPLLRNISNARLFDESIKLFHNTYAPDICNQLDECGLLKELYPIYTNQLEHQPWAKQMLQQALENTSERIKRGKPVTIAYLYAVLLWPEFLNRSPINSGKRIDLPKLGFCAIDVIKEQSQITSIPKRHAFAIKDIWEYQVRLQQRSPKRVMWLLQQRRFRAAFDFLLLRESSGELSTELGSWWETIQFAEPEKQQAMIQELQTQQPKKHKPRRKQQK